MLAGAEVVVVSSSAHGRNYTQGRVIDLVSVPAAHIVVEMTNGKRRLIFCSAIEWIERAS
jgi:hypothetical protein